MSFNLSTALAVGLGGFCGAIVRFYVAVEMVKYFPNEIPLATLLVNIIGSFCIGLLIALFMIYTPNELVKLFLITGFLGALTTYSTFAIESFILLNTHIWYGLLNIALNVFGSIIAAGSGYKLLAYLVR